MMRLVKRGLMFGNLVEVASPALVERYNRGLEQLTGKRTALSEFHIDISGFSPEIGDEFNDNLYLNPNGCNRQFILLTTEQKKAPLLNAQFSMSRDILRDYIDQHEDQLFALTTRDVVIGELMNSVYAVRHPDDLFTMGDIEIEADTVDSHVAAGEELTDKIFRFMEEKDAWWDDVLIAEMIELSKQTGDIIRNPIKLDAKTYRYKNFYTAHFGGAYVFADLESPAFISTQTGIEAPTAMTLEYHCSLKDTYDIAGFLKTNDLVEPLDGARGINAERVLQQKLDFMVIDIAAEKGADLSDMSRRDLRSLRRNFIHDLPEDYHALERVHRAMRSGDRAPRLQPHDPGYFYLLRSRDHRDKMLVNMLLAELCPLDFRQLFICHKDAFYTHYRSWGDTKRDYVSRFLAEEYLVDKVGARDALFGHEPGMALEEEKEAPGDYGFGPGAGPWGSVATRAEERPHAGPWGRPTIPLPPRPIAGPWGNVSDKKHEDDDDDNESSNRERSRKRRRKNSRDRYEKRYDWRRDKRRRRRDDDDDD